MFHRVTGRGTNRPSWRDFTQGPIDPHVLTALDTLPQPPRLEVPAYAATVAELRRRPIELNSRSARRRHLAGLNPSAIVAATPDRDIIVYDSVTTPLHARHAVMHELAHLLMGHYQTPSLHAAPSRVTDSTQPRERAAATGLLAGNRDLVKQLFPALSDEMITQILGRTTYHALEERQAEELATLLLIPTASTPARRRRHADGEQADDPDEHHDEVGQDEVGLDVPGPDLLTTDAHPHRPVTRLSWPRERTAAWLHQALDRLWSKLPRPYTVVADLTLPITGSPQLALYRKVVEVRDALLLLRPYTHPDIHELARQEARAARVSSRNIEIMAEAAGIASAIQAVNDRRLDPVPHPVTDLFQPPAPDIYSEGWALVRLCHRLSHPMITGLVRRVGMDEPAPRLATPRPFRHPDSCPQ